MNLLHIYYNAKMIFFLPVVVLNKDSQADNCQIYMSVVSCSADTVCVVQSSGVPACK